MGLTRLILSGYQECRAWGDEVHVSTAQDSRALHCLWVLGRQAALCLTSITMQGLTWVTENHGRDGFQPSPSESQVPLRKAPRHCLNYKHRGWGRTQWKWQPWVQGQQWHQASSERSK